MNASYTPTSAYESTLHHRHLICWRATVAGFVLAIMVFAGLISLALAFGGIGLSDGSTVQNASIFTGVSIVAACVIAIFTGSYFSVRLARLKVDVVGTSQGLVLASLMVAFVLWQTMSAVGMIGKAMADATGAAVVAAGAGAGTAMQNPAVRDMIEDNLTGSTLKSESGVVVQGLSNRLLRGDTESAKNYLAAQTGITSAEADARIAILKQRFDELAIQARDASATALKASGWSLFLLITLSAIASVLGGLLGSQVNLRRTMDVAEPVTVKPRDQRVLERQPAR